MLIKIITEAERTDVNSSNKNIPTSQIEAYLRTHNNFAWQGRMPLNDKKVNQIRKLARIFVIFRHNVVNFFHNTPRNQFPLSVLSCTSSCYNSSFTVIINLFIVVHPRSKNHRTILPIIGPQIEVRLAMSCI